MSPAYDTRVTPVRTDVAADFLRGEIEAPRYASGSRRQVAVDGIGLRFTPDRNARLESQLLFGEVFTVYDEADGWAWGQNEIDGYVGYVPSATLHDDVFQADHQVAIRATQLYPEPDLKRPPLRTISMCSRVKVVDVSGGFARISSGDWIFGKHLVDFDYVMPDLVGTALKFLGAPYIWGGRSSAGVDCSALVQLVLHMARVDAPRDSDLQAQSVGTEVPMSDPHDFSQIEDGDLVFFPGHVGLFVHGWRFLHANAFDMQVSLHSFSEVLDRADADGNGVTTVRRVGTGNAGLSEDD
jgi:cell wall-associated NlpC family hydrolase